MTVVSNNPSWWPVIDSNITFSYWTIAAGVLVVYDSVLILGQEIELIWKQRWSLMTVLYLVVRYIEIPYLVVDVLENMPPVSLTDAGCNIVYYARNGIGVVVYAMLSVIMIARIQAMYQGSRMMLIFLVTVFLVVTIACGIIMPISVKDVVREELILSGTYMCNYRYEGDAHLLFSMYWMLYTAWEVLALCLAVWIAAKHFRDLRRFGPSTGSAIGDCFRVLIKYHVLYFASSVGVTCIQLANESPLKESDSMEVQIFDIAFQILSVLQAFVLGPRLILSVREYHAKLVADSDAEISMNSIVFQERIHVSTSTTV